MKLLEKIHSIFYHKPKELSDRCEVFLYPETAEKLKRIEKILGRNDYEYEAQRAELFRKVVGVAYFVLYEFSKNNKIIIVERKKKKKIKKVWLSSFLKRAN